MTTKKYIKAHSDDPFEKITGTKLYELDGGFGCRITPNSRMLFNGKQYMARYIAASIYLKLPVAELKEVSTTCDVKNCVLPEHIIFNNKQLTKAGNIDPDAPDENGNIHGFHPMKWEELSEDVKARVHAGTYKAGEWQV